MVKLLIYSLLRASLPAIFVLSAAFFGALSQHCYINGNTAGIVLCAVMILIDCLVVVNTVNETQGDF